MRLWTVEWGRGGYLDLQDIYTCIRGVCIFWNWYFPWFVFLVPPWHLWLTPAISAIMFMPEKRLPYQRY